MGEHGHGNLDSAHIIDVMLFLIVNVYNLLMIGISLFRPWVRKRLERRLGLGTVALVLPIAAAALWNIVSGREWWTYGLPSLLTAFLILEWVLDYVLVFDCRRMD